MNFSHFDIENPPVKEALIDELLHAIGQPLSALQICVLLRDRGAADLPPTLLHDVADQVTSVTRLFRFLRELFVAVIPATPIAPESLLQFFYLSLPKWQHAAKTRQVHLAFHPSLPSAAIHPRPASFVWQNSISEIVEAALLSAAVQGSVTIQTQTSDTDLAVILTGGLLLSERSHTARFALPIASLLLQAPGQAFTYTLQPFTATLTIHSQSPHPDVFNQSVERVT